ncbi:MAG: type III secretion system export apparatus subunit SctR [Parachlamydiaceae bacterium]|nr:type III secretion system export apparatus subunit SctR [Parachlamydiaceae bacterium]
MMALLALTAALWFFPTDLFSAPPVGETPSSSSVAKTLVVVPPKDSNETTTNPSTSRARSTTSETKKAPPVDNLPTGSKELLQDVAISSRPSLITQAVALSLLSLSPFIIMILTSFLKIVVVLGLLRSALGVQQAPPNQIINGVAFMLSLFVMYPTAMKMYDASQDAMQHLTTPESMTSPAASGYIIEVAKAAREPLREFLKRNSSVKHQALFYRIAYKGLPTEEFKKNLKPDDFMIVMPAYITSQLKEAFEIGVLIYIPFFVIDLVTSNILLAMGMMMLSPVTISMPLKLFLLVMLDGWTLLIEGLVNTFR